MNELEKEPAYEEYLSDTTEVERETYSFQDWLDDLEELQDREDY